MESKSTSNFHFALTGKSYQIIRKYFSSFLPKILLNATVLARMSPGQKTSLVEEFQKLNYFVGMCGDGANDCGALKMAHAGISLSEQEASVAAPFTSQNPNIECVPELIRQGRASLVSSFGVFKYTTYYALQTFLATAVLYWQIQILGNYQYFLQDAISLILCLTMSLSQAYPKLAPFRPSGSLFSPPMLLSLFLTMSFTFALHIFGFLFVKQQPWFSKVRSYRECPSVSQPLLPVNSTIEEHRVLGYEVTSLFHLMNFDAVIVSVVFCQGKPFRKPMYTNYIFCCLLCIMLGVCFFILFADIEGLYKALEFLCTPTIWRVYLLIAVTVKFLVSLFVEDAILYNYRLLFWIKALFDFRSSSQYRRLQWQLKMDTSWPPVNRKDFAAEGKSQAYVNPTYKDQKEKQI